MYYQFLACLKFKSRDRRRNGTLKSIAINDIQEDKDHISRLPDDILLQILTLLPTEEVVLTSFVSKRWKSLWIELPLLDLDFISFSKRYNKLGLEDRKHKFLEFVEDVLFHSEMKKFHNKLRLGFTQVFSHEIVGQDYTSHQIVKFIRFAIVSNCSALDIEWVFSIPISTLLPSSFQNESLTHLKLTYCCFIPSILYTNFVSLKTAIFTKVELLEDSLYHLILNSPCLEELQLIGCHVISYLDLHHPRSNLKSFVLDNCEIGSGGVRWLEINIPTLSRFKFAGVFPEHFSIINGQNLIEVALEGIVVNLKQIQILPILKDLRHVKILTLRIGCFEVESENAMTTMPTTYNNLRHLTIKPWSEHRGILYLPGLLRSAPFLETLSIHFDHKSKDDKISWKPHMFRSDFVSCLKKVEIKGFDGGANEMELVKIMLKKSLSLEKMVIYKGRQMKSIFETGIDRDIHLEISRRQQENIIENVLAFSRGSSVAQVIFE